MFTFTIWLVWQGFQLSFAFIAARVLYVYLAVEHSSPLLYLNRYGKWVVEQGEHMLGVPDQYVLIGELIVAPKDVVILFFLISIRLMMFALEAYVAWLFTGDK